MYVKYGTTAEVAVGRLEGDHFFRRGGARAMFFYIFEVVGCGNRLVHRAGSVGNYFGRGGDIYIYVKCGYPWGTSYGTGYHMGVPRGAIFKYEGVHIFYKLVANKGPLGGPYRWDITDGAKYTRIVEI